MNLRRLFRGATESQLDAELRAHLESLTDENIRAGLSPAEARRRAHLELGGLDQVKESCRDQRPAAFLDTLWQDLRYALRQLRHNPGFAAVAIITLALGIGANTAIFSAVYAVLLKPLPFHDADRIVTLWQHDTKNAIEREDAAPANFKDWRQQNTVFENVAAMNPWSLDYTGGDGPESLRSTKVTRGFFDVLGVKPHLGRAFLPEEHQAGREHVTVLSHGLWLRKFGGDPAIIGRRISLDNTPYTVLGVMPADFRLVMNRSNTRIRVSELYAPQVEGDGEWESRVATYWEVLARLKPGVTLAQARAEMNVLGARLAQQYPRENAGMGVTVVPLHEQLIGAVRPALLVLLFAVGLLLLIACVNVANLMLTRGIHREREIATRVALGAGRARLIRQMFTESLLLALLGCAGAAALSVWGIRVIKTLAPAATPRIEEVALDGTVLAFSIALAVLTAIFFGLVPAWQLSRAVSLTALRESAASGPGIRGGRLRASLTVAEVALCVLLLAGAGLLTRSFTSLLNTQRGFDQHNVAALEVYVWDRYSTPEKRIGYFQDTIQAVQSLPGVRSAGATSGLPFLTTHMSPSIAATVEGGSLRPDQAPTVYSVIATPDYFATMSIPLFEGRGFNPFDTLSSPRVALINTTMARVLWPNQSPIGRKFTAHLSKPVTLEVIGVVGDVRQRLDRAPRPEFYRPHAQAPHGQMVFVVRTASDVRPLLASIKARLWSVNNTQPFYSVSTMDALVGASLGERRFHMLLVGSFALLGLLLASVGIYGVISFIAAQRTREIGLRMALGASPAQIMRSVVGQGLMLALAGLVTGLAVSLAVTRSLTRFLFGVTPADPLTYAAVAAVLLAVAVLACYVPARRASRVDPLIALRHE